MTSLYIITFLLGLYGSVTAEAANLVANGNFVAGLAGWDAQFGLIEPTAADGGHAGVALLGAADGSGIGQRVAGFKPGQSVRVSASVQVTSGSRPIYLVVNGQRMWTQSSVGREVAVTYTLAPNEDSLHIWLWFDARTPEDRAEVSNIQAIAVAGGEAAFIVTGKPSGEPIPDFWGAAATLEGDPRAWFGLERVAYMQLGTRRDLVSGEYSGPGRALATVSSAGRHQLMYMGVGDAVLTDLSAVGVTTAKARRWTYSVTGARSAVETLDVVDGRFPMSVGRDEIAVVEIFPTVQRVFRVARPGNAPLTTLDEMRAPSYHMAFWYPTWIGDKGLAALRNNGALIDEVNFFWYDMLANGDIKSKGATMEDINALALAWQAGCLVIPTVTNGFNAGLTHSVLANPANRERHIRNLVDLVVRYGYDGLDLDYESMAATDRELFSKFVEDVAAAFHANNKILSVTVHAKTSDLGGGQGPQSQDYVRIGKAADIVKLMVYDYSWSGGQPGPVSPVSWGDQVLAYARKAIPAYKVMYGLPWYGYDWPGGGVKASSVDVLTARQLAQTKEAATKRDASLEPSFRYKDAGGREHIVFYQDGESYAARLRMMQSRHSELLGAAHWQIGNEAPEMWEVVRAIRQYGL